MFDSIQDLNIAVKWENQIRQVILQSLVFSSNTDEQEITLKIYQTYPNRPELQDKCRHLFYTTKTLLNILYYQAYKTLMVTLDIRMHTQ